LALPGKIRPPAAAATPGTISSHSRAGVYADGPRNGIRAANAPSATSTTPLSAPRLLGTRSRPAMLRFPFVADRAGAHCPAVLLRPIPRQGAESQHGVHTRLRGLRVGGSDGSGRNNPHNTRRPYGILDGLLGPQPSVPGSAAVCRRGDCRRPAVRRGAHGAGGDKGREADVTVFNSPLLDEEDRGCLSMPV
jgi:hypothetical protein